MSEGYSPTRRWLRVERALENKGYVAADMGTVFLDSFASAPILTLEWMRGQIEATEREIAASEDGWVIRP